MRRWQALLALAGLFALGVVSGGLGAHLYYARALDRPPGPAPFLGPLPGHRFERALELTPEQEEQFHRILELSRQRAEELRREMAPRLREVMESADRELLAILTPEQRQRYEELRAAHRGRAERFLRGPGRQRHPRRPGGRH